MKIFKLIQNETIKTFKKTSTKILIILAILALVASAGFSKAIIALNDYMIYYPEDIDWQAEMKEQLAIMKKQLETEGNNYDKQSIASIKAEIEMYELALENNINYMYTYNYNYWKVQALDEIRGVRTKLILNEGNQLLTKEERKDREEQQKIVNEKIALLKSNDYSGYIELKKEEEKAKFEKKEITEEEYKDNIYLLNIKQKYEIYKEDGREAEWKQTIYYDIETIKESLRTGINSTTGKLLKLNEVQKLEDNLKIDEYRLENEIPVMDSMSSERGIYDAIAPEFSNVMVSLLMIIIAGSAVSTEISKGTIKFLLFTPNKRWKVLLSKITSAVLILLVLTIVLSLLSVLIRKHIL